MTDFVAAAAHGWWEWPQALPGALVRRLQAGGRAVAGRDRSLLAGVPQRLAELAQPACPDLAQWLRGAAPYAPVPGAPPPLRCGPHLLRFGVKTYVVAIVNRTPDSFSDGRGVVPSVDETVASAWAAYRAGADIVDVGAESTAEREGGGLAAQQEAERLLPVLDALRDLPAVLSVDTRHGAVARAALALVPVLINDVDAAADPELPVAAAEAGAPLALMHSGPIPAGADAMQVVSGRLGAALARVAAHGVPVEQVVLDAGFGFDTTVEQDLELTRRLGELRRLGRPLLHAPSRKHAVGQVLAFPETIPERLAGTAAAVAVGIAAGADMVRVHDVAEMARVARMTDALVRGPAYQDIAAP